MMKKGIEVKVSDIITVPCHMNLILKDPLQETTLVQYSSVTPIKRSRTNLYRLDTNLSHSIWLIAPIHGNMRLN